MAENKKSFLLYADYMESIEELSDEEAGKLLKHIFRYVNDMSPVCEDKAVKLTFIPIKNQLKRDLENWEIIKGKRSEAGKASAEAKRLAKLEEQNSTKPTSVESVDLDSTKSTVTVNVNDTVTVNGTVINNIEERKLKFASTLQEFSNVYPREILSAFYSYWTEPNKSGTKFRQELERTWGLERRLQTWVKNDNNFKKEKSFAQKEKEQPVAGRQTQQTIEHNFNTFYNSAEQLQR